MRKYYTFSNAFALRQKRKATRERKIDSATLCNIFKDARTEGKWGVPIIRPYDIEPPKTLLPFNEKKRTVSCEQAGIHFYISDFQFIRVFDYPAKYVDVLNSANCVIGPDFSQYLSMPAYQRFANSCNNKLLSAYWQSQGVNVVANVTWSDYDSYSYSFVGIPKNCVIAINSTGIMKSDAAKYYWQQGYKEALKVLRPSAILRYGDKLPCEAEGISIYYPNEHLNRMRHGR